MEDEKQSEEPMADYVFFRGGQELGTLTVLEADFPWYKGEFCPTPEFEQVRPLFEELFLSLTSGTFDETWEKINEPGVLLKSRHDATNYHTFILHIRKNRFRLRILKQH
ncbi:MAG: hypothetical protein ACOVQU_13785 [Exiguobacterium acetylicum]|jgi:hypothetical protein